MKTTKERELNKWRTMPENLPVLRYMTPIPYKATGSRYGACGIRIDGNPEFIDSVLSRLKDLIDGENHVTRLELARHSVDGSAFGKQYSNAEKQAEVCYIRLHMRGSQGSIASGIFDRNLDAATERFERSIS
jgi:hypothetical protein